MNYSAHYKRLIDRSPRLVWVGIKKRATAWKERDGTYREAHRIIPGCMDGLYTCDNVVYLTPEEHYVAHLLLVKMYPSNRGILYGASMMRQGTGQIVRTNRTFGWLRRKMVESISGVNNILSNPIHRAKWEESMKNREYVYRDKPDEERQILRTMMIERNPMATEAGRKAMGSTKLGNTYCKGLRWVNNGTANRRIPPDAPLPEGFVEGNIQRSKLLQ